MPTFFVSPFDCNHPLTMKKFLLLACLLAQISAFEQLATENYAVDPAAIEHPGVPKGEVLSFIFENSKIFPGTSRSYWVYIPAQYNPGKPACVYIN
jgi:hypothetical protein